MTIEQIIFATVVTVILTFIVYHHCKFEKIKECYQLWLRKDYWTDYNFIEAISWLAKAIVIVPGLIFGIQIWQLYFITLITSMMLIWASNKKLLPTLVGFNTLWIWLSMMVISQNIL